MTRIAMTCWIVAAIAVGNVAAEPFPIKLGMPRFDGSDRPNTPIYFCQLQMCKTGEEVQALLMRGPDSAFVCSAGQSYCWREEKFRISIEEFDAQARIRVISTEMDEARFFESANFGMGIWMPR